MNFDSVVGIFVNLLIESPLLITAAVFTGIATLRFRKEKGGILLIISGMLMVMLPLLGITGNYVYLKLQIDSDFIRRFKEFFGHLLFAVPYALIAWYAFSQSKRRSVPPPL